MRFIVRIQHILRLKRKQDNVLIHILNALYRLLNVFVCFITSLFMTLCGNGTIGNNYVIICN